MRHPGPKPLRPAAGALAVALLVALLPAARASSHRYDAGPPVYRTECGSCHVPYPAALLSPAEWRAVMERLDRHYGVDASLDAKTQADVAAWLQQAGRGRGNREHGGAAPASSVRSAELPRITAQRWFVKEHRDATLPARGGARPTFADCAACHADAAQGDFAESGLRNPR